MNDLLPRRGSAAAESAQQVITQATHQVAYNAKMAEPASEAQRRYITDLIRKHDTTTDLSRPLGPVPATMDKALAHKTIEWLKARPLKPIETVMAEKIVELAAKPVPVNIPPRVLTPGAYRAQGYTYNVSETTKRNTWTGASQTRFNVKRYNAVTESFEYVGGPSSLPLDAVRITLAEAIEFGQSTTFCCVCGRHLTNPVSVAAGIGPRCSGRV